MNAQWLDLLSGLDKMIVGSIVGSILLAFFLLIVLFSQKVRAEQKRVMQLRETIEHPPLDAQRLEASLSEQQAACAQTLEDLATAQEQHRYALEQIATLKQNQAEADETIEQLRTVATHHADELQRYKDAVHALEEKLEQTEADKRSLKRRNELWVEQLAQLRTQYEALKQATHQQEHPSR
jgi:chromosome segregation ATPase